MAMSTVVPNIGASSTFNLKTLSDSDWLKHTSDEDLRAVTLKGPFYLANLAGPTHGKYQHMYTSKASMLILLDKGNVQKLLQLMGADSVAGKALIFKTKATLDSGGTVQSVGAKVGTVGHVDEDLANWFVSNQQHLGGAAGWFAQLDYEEYMFINPATDLNFKAFQRS